MQHSDLLLDAGLALALAAGGTPILARLARRWDAVDRPAGHKHHRRPTPLLGGVAIALAVAIVAAWRLALTGREAAGLAVAALTVFAAGLWDDLRGLSVLAKLAAQSAAAVALLASGWTADLPLAALPLTFLWIVGVTNALNLLDNMDGTAAGVAAVAAGAFALLLAPGPGAALAAIVAGAAAGFLIFNAPPARIFMGDAGSLLLGLMLAALAIQAQRQGGSGNALAGSLAAILVLGVPIFDTTLVTVARLRRGRNPLTTPGKDHFPHRLLRLGWSEPATVAALCGLGAVLGGLAFVARSGGAAAWGIAVGGAILAVAAIARLESTGD